LPYFFEGWFTAETLAVLSEISPTVQLRSNTNYKGFEKPDVVIEDAGFSAIVALKHIATINPDAASRWDGGKGSTVAKDVIKLRGRGDAAITRRVLTFYGPALLSAHPSGESHQPGDVPGLLNPTPFGNVERSGSDVLGKTNHNSVG
jgi:hypothetical protein